MAQRIKEAREAAGLTKTELARILGITRSAVSQWESQNADKRTTPKLKHLDTLSERSGYSAEWIRTERGPKYTSSRHTLSVIGPGVRRAEKPTTEIPHVSWTEAAKHVDPVSLQAVADDWLPAWGNVGPRAFALTVVGDAMVAPHGPHTYPPGTIIYVDPDADIYPGRRVLARRVGTGEATFKELAEDAGQRYLKPLNPQYPTIPLTDEWEIAGAIVAIHRSE